MGSALIVVGALIFIVGHLLILIKAFQKSILWGLGSFCVPFVSLIFVILNWSEPLVKKAFLLEVGGLVIYILGIVFGGANFLAHRPQ